MVEHKIGVAIVGEDKASGQIKQVQSALSNLSNNAKTAGNTTSDAFKKAKSGIVDLEKEVNKAGSSFTVLRGAASVFLGELAIKIQSMAIKAVKMLVREMIQLGKEMIALGLESNTSAKAMFDNFNTQVTNLKRLFGEELVVTIGPALQEIATRISELITSGKLDPLVESFGNLAQKVVEMGPEIWDLTKAIMGVANDEEAILAIADAFDRVGYFVSELNKLLDKTAYLIDNLNLDKVAAFIGAGTPGGTLWSWLGAGVEAQSNTTSSGNPTNEKARRNTSTGGLVQTDLISPLEESSNSITRENETRGDLTNTLKDQKAATDRQRLATTSLTASITDLGGTVNATMAALDDALCSLGKKAANQSSTCQTWGFGSVTSDNHSSSDYWFPDSHLYDWSNYSKQDYGVGRSPEDFGVSPPIPVPDALITKQGDVIKFHPEDNILAFKDPAALRGGGGTNITINVNGSGDPEKVAELIMRKINSKVGLAW